MRNTGTSGSDGRTVAKSIAIATTLGLQLVVSVVLGFLLGQWLDGLLHTTPWLTIVGVVVGVGAGFFGIYHLSRILLK